MGWEYRNGRRYYYRKKRRGGRVVSEYCGAGEYITLMANLEESFRDMARLEREQQKEEREAQRAIDRELDRVGGELRALVAAALLASGYHQHKGQWRRKRG